MEDLIIHTISSIIGGALGVMVVVAVGTLIIMLFGRRY